MSTKKSAVEKDICQDFYDNLDTSFVCFIVSMARLSID